MSGGEDFNNNVEMPVGKAGRDTNRTVFMRSSPICTGRGAASGREESLHFGGERAWAEVFNTSVEMAGRNRRRDANGPMFMGCFPVCTGGGAAMNHAILPFSKKRLAFRNLCITISAVSFQHYGQRLQRPLALPVKYGRYALCCPGPDITGTKEKDGVMV